MAKQEKDKLEKFIMDHRSEFDDVDPPENTWGKIQSDVNSKNESSPAKSNFGWIWKVAASIFFVLTVYLSFDKFTSNSTISESSVASNENGYQEFQNAEEYYNGVIQIKREELNEVLANEQDLNVEFRKDIAELDSMYVLLKKDFEVNNDKMVVDAMIYNLRLRIEILDRQLQIIKNLNKIEKTKNDGRNI